MQLWSTQTGDDKVSTSALTLNDDQFMLRDSDINKVLWKPLQHNIASPLGLPSLWNKNRF